MGTITVTAGIWKAMQIHTPSGFTAANALTDDSGAAIAAGLYAFDDQNGTVTAVTGNATDGRQWFYWELARKQQWVLSQVVSWVSC